ncbi:MAG: sulfur transferase domain-containing protein [Verrucomicrobiota bacterium]
MKLLRRQGLLLATGIALLHLSVRAAESKATATNQVAQAIEISGVHNAFRATEKIYSGSQPEGDEAFAAIAKLGVKTIISVDGSKPDIAAARKHGLRYIHLPYGYDGVPTNRIVELAKAAASDAGPFFVHCHHGKHRGPAAVAVMCEATAGWTTNRAETWLREAGTASDYPGLYRAAREFQMPSAAELAAVKELPEVAQSSSLVEAMVAIDGHFEHLKLAQKAGWKQPPGHADISPAHEATLLWEQFREIARLNNTMKRPEDYRTKLAEAEQLTETLRRLLRESADAIAIDAAFKKIGLNCAACHKPYRNQ